jgi:hypothetical protein
MWPDWERPTVAGMHEETEVGWDKEALPTHLASPRLGERPRVASLIVNVGHILLRGYERLRSAIFDPDGDCMRL